ncbi:MAG: hypothetical protein IKP65_00625 [Alphaproteobacteria bacterium]|nr:hypothetical protein [Alphaproteobacteria bacterium]
MNKISSEKSNKILNGTFRGNHPFIIAGKDNFDKINSVIEECRKLSPYANALMNCEYKTLLNVIDMDELFDGAYNKDNIFINSLCLKKERTKDLFRHLVHEYTHFLQDINIKTASYSVWNKWIKNDYKNTIQDFYLLMINETDAYTKAELVFNKNLSSSDMDRMFIEQLNFLVNKVNYYVANYHDYFKYTKIKMSNLFSIPELFDLIQKMLNSGTDINGGLFPHYTLSFDTISTILDEAIISNKKFEMLSKVNHWNEDEAIIKILGDPLDFDGDDLKWKDRLDKFCENSNNKRMQKFLKSLHNTKEL